MSGDLPRPCARCGILRKGRRGTLCGDCRYTLSANEKTIWTDQIRYDLELLRRLAA